MKKIVILGSTGSIGTSALDVLDRHRDTFEVVCLVAGSNVDLLAQQIKAWSPLRVAVRGEEDRRRLKELCPDFSGDILSGEEGAVALAAHSGADLVLSAIVGAAGLKPTYESLKSGVDVALANKESLVIAGKVMTSVAHSNNARLIPVDSEHSAIFQALAGNDRATLRRVGLTASGGPFRELPAADFAHVTVEQALKHPNWSMGDKITIDSATMMNKGLELIEACWLFDLKPDDVQILIHPQSIVHSMVEYLDGSVMAQMGVPDMRCAIAYALSAPGRIESGVKSLNLFEVQSLEFYEPDLKKFRTLSLAYEAIRRGESFPAVLNAANEVAVEAFLNRQIRFSDIFCLLEQTLEKHQSMKIKTIEDVLSADQWARQTAHASLGHLAA
jgi:1-deoxy-D-xylulose-5-phosphate reductoisomerase